MEMLFGQNPWWENKEWEEQDKNLVEFREMKIRWVPRWIEQISFKPFSLNFIAGPRQVGKTTGLKLLIKNLLKGRNEFSVFYLDLEIFKDLAELREAIEEYFKLREKKSVKNSVIILDEVTSLKEWQRIIKFYIDTGKFSNDVIIATGSSTLKVLKCPESFPGRRGYGKDIEVLPLSFKEFLEVNNLLTKHLEFKKSELAEYFNLYMERGGYPKSVNNINISKDLISSIESEIERVGKSSLTLKRIISAIYEMVPSPFSYNAVGNKIGVSNKTVEDYLKDLKNMMVAEIVFFKEKTVNFRKEKKVFFRDPFLAKCLASWCNKELRKDFLYEWVVQEHLLRKFGEIYYYRNSYEIDCIAGNQKVEVKAGKPHRKYPKNVVVLEEQNIPEFLLNL